MDVAGKDSVPDRAYDVLEREFSDVSIVRRGQIGSGVWSTHTCLLRSMDKSAQACHGCWVLP